MNLLDLPRRRLPRSVLWISRTVFWMMLAAVGAASLLPARLMPPIGAGFTEHLVAYAAFALAAALGYGWRYGYAVLLCSSLALAGLFELAQLFLPSRTASWADFAFGSVGAISGVSIAHLIRLRIERLKRAEGG